MEEALLIIGVLLVYGFMAYFNAKVTEKKLFVIKYGVIAALLALVLSFEEAILHSCCSSVLDYFIRFG